LNKRILIFLAGGICLVGGYFIYQGSTLDHNESSMRQISQIKTLVNRPDSHEKKVQKLKVTQVSQVAQQTMDHNKIKSNTQEESEKEKNKQIGLKPHHLYVKSAEERSTIILKIQERKDRQKRMSQLRDKYSKNELKGNNHE